MGGSSFDLIFQELQTQKHIMEEMKAENRKLHEQLAALHTGQGIFLEINGTRMALETQLAPVSSASMPQPIVSSSTLTPFPPHEDKKSVEEQVALGGQNKNNEDFHHEDAERISRTTIVSRSGREEFRRPSTFLEEIMLDEFASALTAPTAIQQTQQQEPKISKEEQKATLRRELIGSFLLE